MPLRGSRRPKVSDVSGAPASSKACRRSLISALRWTSSNGNNDAMHGWSSVRLGLVLFGVYELL